VKLKWEDAMVLIKEIRKQTYRTTDYEEKFLSGFESVDRAQQGIGEFGQHSAPLTSKQGNFLQMIYQKATGGGIYERRQFIGRTNQ
jgi:hypothetical protein